MGVVSHRPNSSVTPTTDRLLSAFGGMVAFCIIVGDTIPHVTVAIFPSLPDVPVLWLLTDRRAVIVLFILGVSFPLSLYRDIAKVRCYPTVKYKSAADLSISLQKQALLR